MGVVEREDNLEELKESYMIVMRKLLQNGTKSKNNQKLLDDFHNAGVKYFNAFERTLDEYSLDEISLSDDIVNRKIEDTINIIDTICTHWKCVKKFAEKYKLVSPSPSPTIYASIQRVIKKFDPNNVGEIRIKFKNAGLPTYGFDDKKKHSGWKKKNKIIMWQIAVGIIILVITGVLSFKYDDLSGMQFMYLKALLSLGISLVGEALLEGSIKVNWTVKKSLVVTAVGWVAIFVLIYFFSPSPAPQV
ncbi:hypothetical protein [Bacillus cereus]|uniref:hypothetical protein n=1 Tax=Bacillus cereus TaxID=1396 RepID=UPI000BED41CD|nr:hypothetical protein [Bacillus cereus]PDZ24604.1 hypothetical protein CON41_02370 [Bacillus cereus]PFA67624.1 hypothetical protein CN403_22810 [Bacillus cereus]